MIHCLPAMTIRLYLKTHISGTIPIPPFFGLKGNVSDVHQQMVNPATGEGTETEEPFHVTDYSFDTKEI